MSEEGSDNSNAPHNQSRTTQQQSNTTQELIKSIIKPQSQIITLQLVEPKYLLWKFQIETANRRYRPQEYILGTLITPRDSLQIMKET